MMPFWEFQPFPDQAPSCIDLLALLNVEIKLGILAVVDKAVPFTHTPSPFASLTTATYTQVLSGIVTPLGK